MTTVLFLWSTHHNGGPADVEEDNYSKQHTSKLSLHTQLELLSDDGRSFLNGLAKVTNPARGGGVVKITTVMLQINV